MHRIVQKRDAFFIRSNSIKISNSSDEQENNDDDDDDDKGKGSFNLCIYVSNLRSGTFMSKINGR